MKIKYLFASSVISLSTATIFSAPGAAQQIVSGI